VRVSERKGEQAGAGGKKGPEANSSKTSSNEKSKASRKETMTEQRRQRFSKTAESRPPPVRLLSLLHRPGRAAACIDGGPARE